MEDIGGSSLHPQKCVMLHNEITTAGSVIAKGALSMPFLEKHALECRQKVHKVFLGFKLFWRSSLTLTPNP